MKPVDRFIALGAIIAVIVLGFVVVPQIGELDQDDALINRGQQVNTCIGRAQDMIDKWRAVGTHEFTVQVDNIEEGRPVTVAGADIAQRAIYDLVDYKEQVRVLQEELIAADNPAVQFDCPEVDDNLTPPPIE